MAMAVPAHGQPTAATAAPGAAANVPPAQRPHSANPKAAADARRLNNRQNSLRRAKNSTEQLRARTRGGSNSSARTDETPTPTPTRAGSRFAVGNVGSNGIIYLRPVVRTGTSRARAPPEPFIFPPNTPPDSLATDNRIPRRPTNGRHDSFPSGSLPSTPARTPAPSPAPGVKAARRKPSPTKTRLPAKPVRSHSFSTVDDHARSQSRDSNTFKVVIDRPKPKRPMTADTSSFPVLDVSIPHYRLGNPRFSSHGTAILRSSVFTRASDPDDFRSSLFSTKLAPSYERLFPTPPTMLNRNSQRYSDISSRTRFYDRPITYIEPSTQNSSTPLTALFPAAPIKPHIYDPLTTHPDDPTVVRYSATGEIVAATPARLIAHITSPSFLDYELLSDFFLTFRSYISPSNLVAYLIARLRWAVERADDFGRIVRVRTFVALRHWILNYFAEDFVPYHQLRVHFCKLVNELYKDLENREDGGGGDLKIIGELKKCWRRTCALYWDDDETIGRDVPDDDVLPGGQAEETAPEAGLPPVPSAPLAAPQEPSTPPRKAKPAAFLFPAGATPEKYTEWMKNARHAPQQSQTSIAPDRHDNSDVPLSPASEFSMQAMSCSIPLKGFHRTESRSHLPLRPHPVPAHRSSAAPSFPASARQCRPSLSAHKRSGSFSDALRDHRAHASVSRGRTRDPEVMLSIQYPGSLVRGAMFQPDSPYINLRPSGQLRPMKSHFDLVIDTSGTPPATAKSSMTNPGMKKILGSVRRALSSRQGYPTSSHGIPAGSPVTTHRDSASTAAFTSASQPGARKRRYTARNRPQGRIDVLSQRVAESFRQALEAELELEKQAAQSGISPHQQGPERGDQAARPASDPVQEIPPDSPRTTHPSVQRGLSKVTLGSGSILIFDDTGAPPLPVMSGALPAADVSATEAPDASRLYEVVAQTEDEPNRAIAEPVSLPPVTIAPDVSLPISGPPGVLPPLPDDMDSSGAEIVNRAMTSRPSILRHSKSMRSGRAGSTSLSLRRFASYHSGMTRNRPGYSIDSDMMTRSSDNDPFFLDRAVPTPPLGGRMLRRRPGGDLRAVHNVHDLEALDRPRSTGSLSNLTHSVTNSMAFPSLTHAWRISQNILLEDEDPPTRKSLSLVGTHSSQPALRPSFEVEVARLAALPDDEDDDGGIESALLKLEGKYERKSPDPSPRQADFYSSKGTPSLARTREDSHGAQTPDDHRQREEQPEVRDSIGPLPPLERGGASIYQMSHSSGQYTFSRAMPAERSLGGSHSSYSSIPLLDRGVSDIVAMSRRRLEQARDSERPAPLSPDKYRAAQMEQKDHSAGSSMEHVEETESMRRIPRGSTVPRSPNKHSSFLLNPDEEFDDLSSEISTSVPNSRRESHGVRSFFDDEPAQLDAGDDLVPHPLRHPPTPPVADKMIDNTALTNVGGTVFNKGLPTPGLTPPLTAAYPFNKPSSQFDQRGIEINDAKSETRPRKVSSSESAPHIPFVLAYDSETLAEQFTVIEKDALDEIDWKELIELRWKQSCPKIRDWVEYLRTQEPRGVDVVIARFNIMVKWALSETVLTEDLEERVRCIVKFIHIANHARRLRNYATMYQITVALLSTDCARLTKTWSHVPAEERRLMGELENLVQPVKNFHNLRLEMETSGLEEGCIPFIGIYTRDLIYNAQKPATIGGGEGGAEMMTTTTTRERLINFERHHTAATIVKNLLRLLEASSNYRFGPLPDVIPKCLWVAALSDEEISARSRLLE